MKSFQLESEEMLNSIQQLDIKFRDLENIVKQEILGIKWKNSFDDAENSFAILSEILSSFGKVVFNSNYQVSEYMYDFFTNFDRIDVINERKRLFHVIKSE